MKKALSLALALMMLMTMICTIPVMAAAAEGSAENPIQVNTPRMIPTTVSIAANSATYYHYIPRSFAGWTITAYGVSAIIVDNVVFDTPNMRGAIEAYLNFNFMSTGIVAFVKNLFN